MASPRGSLRASLLADLRTLAQEAKRPDSFTGQLTGWMTGPEHPGIRDAAERVAQQLADEARPEALDDSEVRLTYRPGASSRPRERAIGRRACMWQ